MSANHRRLLKIALLLTISVLVLAACAAGENPSVDTPDADGDTAGFFMGLWHGIIIPFTFIVSLFSDSVNVYEIHNNGNWYDFGFVLGAGTFLGGGGAGAKRSRR